MPCLATYLTKKGCRIPFKTDKKFCDTLTDISRKTPNFTNILYVTSIPTYV